MRSMASTLPLPKYHRIYLVLREQLHEGRFAAGLPGELALMQQFGVARVTVRRALQELAGEGLISRALSDLTGISSKYKPACNGDVAEWLKAAVC